MFDRFWHKFLQRPYRLHTRSYGDATLPTLILVHGLGATSNDWKHFIPVLSKHYHCITIDLLGCGQSPKPQWCEYYTEDFIASLHYTIRRLHLSTYMLMGHSLGSLLITRYASQYPEGITRLFLLSPPVYPSIKDIKNRLAKQRTSVLLSLYQTTRREFVTQDFISRLAFILPPARSVTNDPLMWLPTFKALENSIEKQSILEDIQAVSIPVDVWYGLLDEVVIGQNVALLSIDRPNVSIHTYGRRHILTKQYAAAFTAWLLGTKTARKK